jgi:hypothetical protein
MDYNSFYTQQYPNLSGANLPSGNTQFSLNPNRPNAPAVNRQQGQQQQGTQQQQQRQQQQQQTDPRSQLQSNMFFLDPYNTKLEQTPSVDRDHASYSSFTPIYLFTQV